jgi:hypothetical protein
VEKCVAIFRRGQKAFEDELRSAELPHPDFADEILRFLEKYPHSSSRKSAKLYAPRKSQSFEFYMIVSFISSLCGGYRIICLRIKRPRS